MKSKYYHNLANLHCLVAFCHATLVHKMMIHPPTCMEKLYFGLEKGLEKILTYINVEVWEPCF